MRSYVQLVEALLDDHEVRIAEILPGTGDGVAKLGVDKRPFNYHIERWVPELDLPLALRYIKYRLDIPRADYYTTFNGGIGLYLFVEPEYVGRIRNIGEHLGYPIYDLGSVMAGSRKVIFEPEDLILKAPGG